MNEALKNKLSNYEAMPPEGNWDRIANALDEGQYTFPEKLYKYQSQPPADVWNRISLFLNNLPANGKVVPMFRRYKKQLSYAGVAAVLFALVFFSRPYFATEKKTEIPFHNTITSTPVITPLTDKVEDDTAEKIKDISPGANGADNISITKSPKRTQKEQEIEYPGLETIAMLEYIPSATIQNELMMAGMPADNYMIYTDETGHSMKLPKKLFDAFDCATKEIVCRQKIRDLQNRFASSAVSSDFTGLLEILRNLQENQ